MVVDEKAAGRMFCGPYRQTASGNTDLTKYCNGSNCMMWRWLGISRVKGFCGLAGEPGRY